MRAKKNRHQKASDTGVGRTVSPTVPRQLTVDVAAREGTTLEQLVALRTRLAEAIADPKCPPRDLAALQRGLRELFKEIAAEEARIAEEASGVAATVPDGSFDPASI